MLYLLKRQEGPEEFYYLFSGKEYTVGRRSADISINNDQSISRKHAVIKVGANFATLLDCGSKYGTTHKGKKIAANTEVQMEDRDVIKFGVFQSTYIVERINIVTTGSGLSSTQKNDVKKNVEFLSGSFINNWDSNCTHLTVEEIMLTIKVLHALIDDRPLIKPEYWAKYVENINAMRPAPKVEDFEPPIAETLLNKISITPDPRRRVLFKDKIFVFPTEKIKSKMDELIVKTGGICISWDKQPLKIFQLSKQPNNYLFIHSDEIKQVPQSLKEIYEHIAKLGQRTIPIQEIAMAILLCSCEKDCNPNFNLIEKVFMKMETGAESEVFSLAPETQTEDLIEVTPKQEISIPGSLDGELEMLSSINHNQSSISANETLNTIPCSSTSLNISKRTVEDPQESSFKRIKLDNSLKVDRLQQSQISCSAKKRKAEDILGTASKKSSLRENPFAAMKNRSLPVKTASDNPFVALRIKTEVNQEDNNPFKKVEETTMESGVEDISSFVEPSSSYITQTKSTSYSTNWLSKTNCKNETIEIEDEFKDIFDKFRNSVVIQTLPFNVRRVDTSANVDASLSKSPSAKNFKKFKKVRPLRPQINIISATVAQYPLTKTNEVTILSDGEEDEEIHRPMAKKTVSKRFHF